MYAHHEETIDNAVRRFKQDSTVEALLLVGSIAHGFESPGSDVDVMLLVSEQRYQELSHQGTLTVFNKELSTYAGGYVDGKYLTQSFLRQVASCGSEPARFAFEGARVLFSRSDALDGILKEVVKYPEADLPERIRKFSGQLEAWNWYLGEAFKQDNRYLQWLSVSKLVLFGARLVLAHNRVLYPYHKWLLRVLERAANKPEGMLSMIAGIYECLSVDAAQEYYEAVRGFQDWGLPQSAWPTQFMKDVELGWQRGIVPVDEL